MTGYTTRRVAEILGIPPTRVRSLARSGFVDPTRGPRNEYRFSFSDIILLRTTRDLRDAGVSMQRVRKVLRALREQLPEGESLSALHITSDGDTVVVRDEDALWDPQSGQAHLDFSVRELAEKVAPITQAGAAQPAAAEPTAELTADEWYDLALDLEPAATDRARDAYRRALALNPGHVRAHLNLGRLLHEAEDVERAETHYRQALAADPDSPTAAFNLGVALGDLGRAGEAIEAYKRALRSEPDMASAHYNLSRLYEAEGRTQEALRHLADYKRLV